MNKLLMAALVIFGSGAGATTGADHSGGDPLPTQCLRAVVEVNEYDRLTSARLDLDFEARGTQESKYSRDCLFADFVRSSAEKDFFHLSSSSNVNAMGLGLDEAPLILRFVCTNKAGYDDFYIVKDNEGGYTARYSQFLVSCPLEIQ